MNHRPVKEFTKTRMPSEGILLFHFQELPCNSTGNGILSLFPLMLVTYALKSVQEGFKIDSLWST